MPLKVAGRVVDGTPMLRVSIPLLRASRRALGLLLGALVLALVTASGASAEEAVVLDNGTVLRGSVIREDVTTIQLKLSGVGRDNRVTVEKDRIVQRFTTATAPKPPDRAPAPSDGGRPFASDPTDPRAPVPLVAGLPRSLEAPYLPEEEPLARQESIFDRIGRRALMSFPSAPLARAFLAGLGVVLLLCLVGLGAKMADIKGLTLANGTVLALLLGALLTITVLWADPLLRADLAALWLPIALLAWTGCAASILKCRLGRSFVLLAFVLFAGLLTSFSAGVVLIAV